MCDIFKKIEKDIPKLFSDNRIFANEPMAKHTSFKIGGICDIYVQPSTREEVLQLIEVCRKNGTNFIVLGHASNVLVPDEGLRNVVIQLYPHFSACTLSTTDGITMRAQAGASLASIAYTAQQNGLTGLEFASGIPGTVGGAICMNAGAYGHEIADVCDSVTVLMPNDEIKDIPVKDMGFGYRKSIVQDNKGIVIEAKFTLKKGNKEAIAAYTKELNERRRNSQPLDLPSVGSTFKRPAGHFAAKLIDDCGLKGFAVGGAMVSNKHAGFVVNSGGATAKDVLDLMEHIQKSVMQQYNIQLEPEVQVLCSL